MENTATIDLNGTRYDAVTGVPLGAASAPQLRGGHNIDGFFRPRTSIAPRSMDLSPPVEDAIATILASTKVNPARMFHDISSHPTTVSNVQPEPAPKPVRESAERAVNHTRAHAPLTANVQRTSVPVRHHITTSHNLAVRRGEPNHTRHRNPQHSATLRRDAVPAPELTTHNTLKPSSAVRHTTPGLIELKKAAVNVDEDRLIRAQNVSKSPLVTRHGSAAASSFAPTFAPLAVQPAPIAPAPVSPPPGTGEAPEPPSPQPNNKPTTMFEQALANANHYVEPRAHANAFRTKARWHAASMAAGVLVLAVALGSAAWENSPALQLKTASVRSGVVASMPHLAGTGLSYSGVRTGDGKITMGLVGSAGSSFQVTAVNSNLSSGDLIADIGSTDASGTPQYSVLYVNGTAVYRLSNTDATWIAGGKWYTLTGNQAISDTQVKTIVSHL